MAKKRKRKGERAQNHLFYHPLLPTFGTFEIIRFLLWNCWNVNELESFSNFSRDYFARHLSVWLIPYASQSNLECKNCVLRQHKTFTLCQNAACSSKNFLLQLDYALEGSTFWMSKLCEFCCLFHAERLGHACWFSEVIVSGWHDW